MALWDGIQKEQKWTRIVQHPASGKFYEEVIDETTRMTKWVQVAGPVDPHPFP